MTAPARTTDTRPGGLLLVAAMVTLMWVSEAVDAVVGPLAPFLHAGVGHLIANTVPFLVMGAIIALSGLRRVLLVTMIVALVSGLGTWLVAPSATLHIGASGVVFGYAAYLVARGLFDRRWYYLLTGLAVALLQGGSLLLGLVPQDGISWQGHLFGALGGLLAARLLARRPTSPRH